MFKKLKKFSKVILFVPLCMLSSGLNCSEPATVGGPCYEHVMVYINEEIEEYREKFDAREFTLADFKLDYAKDFFYNKYYTYDGRYFAIRFTKGLNYIREADAHLRELEFVSGVRFYSYYYYIHGVYGEEKEFANMEKGLWKN